MKLPLTILSVSAAVLFADADESCTPPVNDLCENAIPLSFAREKRLGDTTCATPDDVPLCSDGTRRGSNGIWYVLYAADRTTELDVFVNTCSAGTTYDTQLTVFKGSCDNLQCVAGSREASQCLDDGKSFRETPWNNFDGRLQAQVSFDASPDDTYYVLVDGYCDETEADNQGSFDIKVQDQLPPPNDKCPNAEPLCGSGIGKVVGDTTFATREDISRCGVGDNGPDSAAGVWYSFSTVNAGNVMISTCGKETTLDSQLHLFDGSCGSLNCLVGDVADSVDKSAFAPSTQCEDDWDAEIYFEAEAGKTYYVYVNGYSDTSQLGQFQISVSDGNTGVLSPSDCDTGNGGTGGDPHFKTWTGKWYDYHGAGDLVFLTAPRFGLGLGLDIHVRTTIRYDYSFIESAALKIGDDILEVSSYGNYMLNGVLAADMPAMLADKYPITYTAASKKEHAFKIALSATESIVISTFKDLVSVKVNGATSKNFGDSAGMIGDFHFGNMVGRDRKTIITDANGFGQEWQVTDKEPKLFHVSRSPQYPEPCQLPVVNASVDRRRLGESIAEQAAVAACAHWKDEQERKICVFDVMATGDLEHALAGAF